MILFVIVISNILNDKWMYSYDEIERLVRAVKLQRPSWLTAADVSRIAVGANDDHEHSIENEMLYNSNGYTLGREEQQFVDKLQSLGVKLGLYKEDAILEQFGNATDRRGKEDFARAVRSGHKPVRKRERYVKKAELNKYILSRILNHGLR